MNGSRGRLAGKVAIITGGGVGCGPVMAKRFVEEGARVLVAARRLDLIEEAARNAGGGSIAVRADISNENDVRAMVDRAMNAFGQVDIMINNAVVAGEQRFIWDQTLENWNNTIAVNLTGAMLCTREVLNRSMLERKTGVILNISSVAAWVGIPGMTDYVSAKAALRTLTKTVAREVGEFGIRCNCMVPGSIDTEAWRTYRQRLAAEKGMEFESYRAAFLSNVPLKGQITTPDDIANFALFLVSNDSRTITGQSINIDAGSYMVG